MTIGWHFDNTYSKLPDTFKEDGTDTQILHTESFKLGKGRLKNFDWKESSEIKANQKDYPLILTTSRVLQHYNAATMTRRTKNINIVDEDVLLVHPKDAALRELNTGAVSYTHLTLPTICSV